MVDLHPLFLSLKKVLQQQGLSVEVYIFGSALYERFPNDIDILVIYSTSDELLFIKSQLFQISLDYPLDIYYMTLDEVNELDFINTTKAVHLEAIIKR
ncbi:hypothetical protein [Vibrio splendidus]|uniref:Polymerase beta nucleotidyltransferase domain-containing protein n=1 Tax=Vibrio splendidus TaxID=29497 RepID=A0A2T5E8N4_VIBSP|nr:hypothetical protein [Vibrio splendidus]OEE57652.1 hypothetical protein A147_22745 [Vibrio splendidus FF-6]PTP15646.1 hypothetical protein CWO36_19760 [Vibrio splendidus]